MNHKESLKKWHHGSSPGQTVASLMERERVAMELESCLKREGHLLRQAIFPIKLDQSDLILEEGNWST